MKRAPVGAVVGIYYDGHAQLELGHALKTPTGRTYVVVAIRRQQRGKHRGRWHLRCLVADAPPAGVPCHPLYWYRRDRRQVQQAIAAAARRPDAIGGAE